ncbi:Acetoin utilization deacetylase AcuC or a related deacetylase [Gulbenkiania indica]|uniref:Acetoin utilization deacetylase AcuC or a related deacetylase n=1 Tax=Gulbenkiania indica TaxID=375574 RepID=A0A0K6GV76_9NEIS|nr:histone deacetylase [Gulbenkiania indica]CUA82509.1 Acetoin utilization deacetylase AcuC or a related deacetylase [Gulbenkiania indica]
MHIYRTDVFPMPLPPGHRFPAEKYALLTQAVAGFAAEQLAIAPPASRDELCSAHAPSYVDAVLGGTVPPAVMREIGFPWSPGLVERSCRSVGATVWAALSALESGCGINLAGGTHHASADKGSGFCVFNDVAVAIRTLQRSGRIRRALVVDLDVHQGNGTAAIFAGDPSVFTFSMHGARNFPFRRTAGSLDIDLPDGTGDDEYLAALSANLEPVLTAARADIVFYLAGADPYAGDRLGKLSLTKAGLAARDRQVLQAVRQSQLSLVVTMAGGYAVPVSDTVDIQTATVRLTLEAFGQALPQ